MRDDLRSAKVTLAHRAVTGIAFAFFAAFSTLCAVGVRYPLRTLPVLFVQLLYKSVWLVAVALPLWTARQW